MMPIKVKKNAPNDERQGCGQIVPMKSDEVGILRRDEGAFAGKQFSKK